MKKQLTTFELNKKQNSNILFEKATMFQNKLKTIKNNFMNNFLKRKDIINTKNKKNNYEEFQEEVTFEQGDMGFDKYGNLVKW